MSIKFSCPTCGRQFDVADDWAGMRAACETCGAVVTVPGGVQLSDQLTPLHNAGARSPMMPTGPAPTPQPFGESVDNRKLLIFAAAGVGGLLVLLVVAGLILSGGNEENLPPSLAQQPYGGNSRSRPSPNTPPTSTRPSPRTSRSPAVQPPRTPAPLKRTFQPADRSTSVPASRDEAADADTSIDPSADTNARPPIADTNTRPARTVTPTPSPPPQPTPPAEPPRPVVLPPIQAGNPIAPEDAKTNSALLARIAEAEEPVWSNELPEKIVPRVTAVAGTPAPAPIPIDSKLYDRGTILELSDTCAWSVKPDAPPNDWEYKEGRLAIKMGEQDWVRFPSNPSRFVLVVEKEGNENSAWKVHDLSTGNQVGKSITRPAEDTPTMFSAWGRYVAVRSTTVAFTYRIDSFVTGETVCEMRVAARGLSYVAFSGAHELLSIETESSTTIVRIWDLRSVEMLQCFTIPDDDKHRYVSGSMMVSPGGRYFCRIEGDRWSVYDLEEVKCAGHMALPESPSRLHGQAFTDDGSRLAMMVEKSFRQALLVWDFRTGEVMLEREYPRFVRVEGDPALQWLPDKSALLYREHIVLDGDSGDPIWTFPAAKKIPRRMISFKKMLTLIPRSGGKALGYIDLPEEDLITARDAIHLDQ